MSDTPSYTPRTDQEEYPEGEGQSFKVVSADFARQLERELNEALLANKTANSLIGSQADENDKIVNQLRAELEKWKSMAKELAESEKCPNCDDVGWFTSWRRTSNGEPEPEQCQCEYCETNPKSRFKALTRFTELEKSI